MQLHEILIVIQGPIRVSPHTMETAWAGFNIMWSTWVGENITTDNPVLHTHPPVERGPLNLGLQVASTLAGLRYAQEKGYGYALKWRSDMIPTDAGALLDLFNPSAMNVLYWCTADGGYYTDYFTFGSVEQQLDVWNIENANHYKFPEQALTERLSKYPIRCIGDFLTNDNDILWYKYNIKLHTYKEDSKFANKNI
jgi:hypothetical protein